MEKKPILFLFVEGSDDTRFFQNIIAPHLRSNYYSIKIIEHRQMKKQKLNALLCTIFKMKSDYIFLRDLDFCPCIEKRKKLTCETYPKLNVLNLHIVVQMIEGWYIAGLTIENAKQLGINKLPLSELINKDSFNDIVPNKFDSKVDFMMEILKIYNHDVAMTNNNSFKLFVKSYMSDLI